MLKKNKANLPNFEILLLSKFFHLNELLNEIASIFC